MNQQEIESLYTYYRSKYFGNILPPVEEVQISVTSQLKRAAGNCRTESKIIKLSYDYHYRHPEELPATLLHEMIHLVAPGHGMAFHTWMNRINNFEDGPPVVHRHSLERAVAMDANWVYECIECDTEYNRVKRLPKGVENYLCKCGGMLVEHKQ